MHVSISMIAMDAGQFCARFRVIAAFIAHTAPSPARRFRLMARMAAVAELFNQNDPVSYKA